MHAIRVNSEGNLGIDAPCGPCAPGVTSSVAYKPLTRLGSDVRWSPGRIPRSPETEDRHEALVDAPHLLGGRQRDAISKTTDVNCSDLLNQDH
jgi:hypothetical protein